MMCLLGVLLHFAAKLIFYTPHEHLIDEMSKSVYCAGLFYTIIL